MFKKIRERRKDELLAYTCSCGKSLSTAEYLYKCPECGEQLSFVYDKLFSFQNENGSWEHACTCGYHVYDAAEDVCSCPDCGTDCLHSYRTEHLRYSLKKHFEEMVHKIKVEISSHECITSSVAFMEIHVDINPNEKNCHIEINQKETREVSLSLINKNLAVKFNGNAATPTLQNLARGLSHVSPDMVSGTVFDSLGIQMRSSSLSKVATYLWRHPWYEKLWSQDKSISLYPLIHEHLDLLNEEEQTPAKILGLPKPLYKKYSTYARGFIPFDIESLHKLIELYGAPKAEHLIDLSINMIQKYGYIDKNWIDLMLTKKQFNYDYERLYEYLTDDIYTYQGINSPIVGANLLSDYLTMCERMDVKPDKYPRSLKLAHDLATKNYKVALDEITEKLFRSFVSSEEYQQYVDVTEDDFIVIAPKEGNDLTHEGAALSHCVSSYVEKVANRNEIILFMRRKSEPEKSLVTLDICKNRLVQAAGFGNRSLSKEEQDFVMRWIKRKKLSCSIHILRAA